MGSTIKSEEKVKKPTGHLRQRKAKLWSRLQTRMTVSYVMVCVATALLFELVLILLFFVVVPRLPFVDQNTVDTAKGIANVYALEAAVQANGVTLNPRSTFQPGQPLSLPDPSETIPSTNTNSSSSASRMIAFVLLVSPNGQVLASSDPARYPTSASVARLLPTQSHLISDALAGKVGGSRVEISGQAHIVSVAQPVLNKEKKAIGAVYVQMQPVTLGFSGSFFGLAMGILFTALFWIIFLAPVGAVFGVITTRGLVRRIQRLVAATAHFAHGDYTQRVPVTRQDEIGQLESQFNSMAQQLVESIAQQQVLTEQHARLEERARIEQELRTAQYIQQALLPEHVPALPGWQITPFYRPAREVGGDFYDFHPLEDGRLGLVIGDATGKGVPAALVMTTTSTMLRAAAQGTRSPGRMLAQVNDLLAATIPAGMFVTCFYAILDPANGSLCYANAGHDWPYRRYSGGISTLQATGMPLGMMPGTSYEEQEAALEVGESLFFFSDGLVEAHNANREMFGLPRLEAVIDEHPEGSALIDIVLSELAAFTGAGWEQEDDVTLLTLQRAQRTVGAYSSCPVTTV